MASKVFTSRDDETLIRAVQMQGLRAPKGDPKWRVLRIALALSLRYPEPPAESFDDCHPKDGEYALAQLCGEKQEADYTDAMRALLSVHHDVDLFADDDAFVRLLQRHVRRGLQEIERGWAIGHDFHEFLYQELFGKRNTESVLVEDISQKLLVALRRLEIRADIREVLDGPRLRAYRAVLADAGHLRLLQKHTEELAFDLACGPIGIEVGNEPRQVDILVPKPRSAWQTVTWDSVAAAVPAAATTRLGVALGVDPQGRTFSFDLAAAPHMLVGGTTGSGKSVCLHAMICSLLLRHGPNALQLCLIDPKRTELSDYAGLPHLWDGSPVQDVGLAADTLSEVAAEMDRREIALASQGYKQLAEWRDRAADAPPFIVVVVEELADLLLQRPEAEAPLVRLAQKGRASGIHLVLATQRPDSVTFSGLLRSNVPCRIALTVQKSTESRIIVDEVGAELLLGHGDMLVKLVGEPLRRVHGAYVDAKDIRAAVAAAKGR